MNGVEAAASLFGSDEPSSDPFAALGSDTVPQSSSGDLFYDDGASGSSDFLSPETTYSTEGNTAPDTLQPYAQQEPAHTGHTSSPYTSGSGATTATQQGWYEEQVQPSYFGEHVAEATLTRGLDNQYSQYQDRNSTTYDPYAPPSNQTTSTIPPAYPQTQYNVSTYSQPVIPPNPYIPAPVVPTQSSAHAAYSYTPSTLPQSTASTYSSSYASVTQSAYAPLNVNSPPPTQAPPQALPPVPPPVATINRPKVSNAYDPPFPTTKSSRRGARTGSGQQPFTGYNAYQPLSPPVPEPYATPPQYPPPPPSRVPQQHPSQSPVYHQQPYLSDNSAVHTTNVIDSPFANALSQGLSTVEQLETPWLPETFSSQPADESYTQAGSQPASTNLTMDLPNSGAAPEHIDTYQYMEPYSTSHDLPTSPGDSTVQPPPSSSESRAHASSPVSQSGSMRSDSPYRYALPVSPTSVKQMPFGRSSPRMESDLSPTARKASPISYAERLGNNKLETSHVVQGFNTGPRTASPVPIATTDVNGVQSPQLAYLPKSLVGDGRVSSPANSLNGQQSVPFDPYAPKAHTNGYSGERTSSPGSFSLRSSSGLPVTKQSTMNHHTPPRNDVLRNRSMSSSSMLSTTSTSAENPYAPSQNTRRQGSEADYGTYSSRYNYPQGQEINHNLPPTQMPQHTHVQEVSVKPFHTPYAPSPSLLGANDPLGRTAARVPIFSFGFGGKLVTCFHGAASLNTGFDVALSSRNSTGVHIRVLKTLIPESALSASTASFPGPLFSDPGASTGLVRTGASTYTKTKKANVIKYLSERAEEITMGLPYVKADSAEGHQAEGKLALVKVLKVMVENDGRLTGTPQLDNAVRVSLVPRLEQSTDVTGSLVATTVEGYTPDLSPVPYPAVIGASTHSNESPISVTTLRTSALNTIQDFLLRGERRQAYHFALDERLWAHAMVIASSIDKDSWKEVVNEFLKIELGANVTTLSPIQNGGGQTSVNGRESLRVAYSLFSGQGAAAVQELIPQNILSKTTAHLQPAIIPHMTPRTPNFGLPIVATSIPIESISQWAEAAAMMVSSPLSPETSAALTALGDQLVANHMYEAAHVCYLLAPQTSPLGGVGNPAARIVLVGSRSPQSWPSFAKDTDCLILSEIVEFALSLAPTPRGQDAFQGIPHLQAYRFIRAMNLAEIGDIILASRYCEAITATINRSSPYFTPILVDQLKGLSDRIVGVAHVDKMGSWMGAKLSKPSLDTIGGWLENRFTKIVTGDADTATPPEEEVIRAEDRSFAGPFAHYSTISSATPSARSSPQPSFVNLNVLPPPQRSGSAMASSSPYSHPQIDRASSAMDYVKRKPSPGPRISSAGAATTTFTNPPSFGQALSNHRSPNGYSPQDNIATARPSLNTEEDDNPTQEATWWGSSAYDESSTTQTPTASTFLRVDEGALTPSSDGFVSLMDNDIYSVTSKSPPNSASQQSADDEEDLGFGNSKRDKPTGENGSSKATPAVEVPKETAPPPSASAPATGGSWISRWWKKSDSATPGPIKASLGEESAFYYDKEQKRWVNKKAGGSEAPKPSVPPPPSRAQTASPGMTGQRPPGASDAGPPPPRSASAIDLSTSPPSRTVMRVRSNLVPTPESAPSTPTGTRLGPPGPPPGRPKSQASKRNIRSRYVDVFQQEGGA